MQCISKSEPRTDILWIVARIVEARRNFRDHNIVEVVRWFTLGSSHFLILPICERFPRVYQELISGVDCCMGRLTSEELQRL